MLQAAAPRKYNGSLQVISRGVSLGRKPRREQRTLFGPASDRTADRSGEGASRRVEAGSCDGGERPVAYTASYPLLQAFFLETVKKLREQQPLQPLVILVPTWLGQVYLRRQLVERGLTLCNVHFATLDSFASRLYTELSTPPSPLLPSHAAPLLAADIAPAALAGTYFDRVREMHGFQHALLATVLDLKEACITPEDLEQVIEAADGAFKAKLDALRKFWIAYEESKRRKNVVDLPDVYTAVTAQLHQARLVRQGAICLVYGFYDFKGIQYRFLERLTRLVPVAFFLPVDASPAYEYAIPTLSTLTSSLGACEQEVPKDRSGERKRSALACAQQFLFDPSGGSPPSPQDTSVRLVSMPTDTSEPELIVRLVADALAECDNKPYRVAIVTRSGDQLARYIAALRSHGLTVADGGRYPMSATPGGAVVSLLLDLASESDPARRYPRDELLRLLEAVAGTIETTGEVNRPAPAWTEHLFAFDAATRYAGIVSGRDEWLDRLDDLAKRLARRRDGNEDGADVLEIPPDAVRTLRSVVAPLIEAIDALVNAATWEGAVAALAQALLALYGSRECLPPSSDGLLAALSALQDYSETFHLPLFLACVGEVMESLPGVEESPRYMEAGVVAADVMSIRGARFDIIIVPEMIERQFPLAYRQDPILLDDERDAINRHLSDRPPLLQLPLRRRRPLEERLLFKIAVDSCDRSLWLTYARYETGTARPVLPSPYVLDVLRALGCSAPTYRELALEKPMPCVEYVPVRCPDPQRWSLNTRQFIRLEAIREVETNQTIDRPRWVPWVAAAKLCPTLSQALKAERRRWGSRRYTEFDGWLTNSSVLSKLVDALLHDNATISVSMLDDYSVCPYAFLLRHVLDLDAEPDPIREYRVPATTLGRIAHDILAKTFDDVSNLPSREQLIARLHDAATEVFNDVEQRRPVGYPVLWEVEKQRLLESLETLVAYEHERLEEEGRWPCMTEKGIGGEHVVKTPGGEHAQLSVVGRIDRIDVDQQGRWYVVDYKSQSGSGAEIQLGAYALLAAKQIPECAPEKFGSTEFVFYSYRRTTVKKHKESRSDLQQIEAEITEAAAQLVNGVKQGDFRQRPDDNTCRACNFNDICMDLQFVVERLKEGSSPAREEEEENNA